MNFQQKNNFVTVYKLQQSLINNLCHSDFQLNIDLTHLSASEIYLRYIIFQNEIALFLPFF